MCGCLYNNYTFLPGYWETISFLRGWKTVLMLIVEVDYAAAAADCIPAFSVPGRMGAFRESLSNPGIAG